MQAGDFALGVDNPTLDGTGGGEKCINLQEGLAIIAKYERFSEALHPRTEPEDIPECSAAGRCQQRSAMVRGEERFLRGGGRWAQVCDLFLSDALEVLSGAVMSSIESSDSLAALVALNQIPCACRWLLFAQRLSGSFLLPSGPEASLTMPRPDPYNCPKDAGTGLYTCDELRYGASPDGVVVDRATGEEGLLEVKCLYRERRRSYVSVAKPPARFLAQVPEPRPGVRGGHAGVLGEGVPAGGRDGPPCWRSRRPGKQQSGIGVLRQEPGEGH